MQTNNKLREVIEKLSDLFERGVICTSYANTAEEMEQIDELYQMAKAALAEPVRNCEVGTAKEQKQRYDSYCFSRGCRNCPLFDEEGCNFAWAQLPYVEKEGDAK